MLSIREQRFLNELQKKYKKKIIKLVNKGESQTVTVDGIPLALSWTPHLDKLIDVHGDTTQVLLDDCIDAIKESIAVEKKHKREAKKAYIKQNK